MDNFQSGSISVDVLKSGIKIGDSSQSGAGITIPKDALEDLIQFLTYHSNIDKAEERRSFRLSLEPNSISVMMSTENDSVAVIPQDLSLGGMCVKHYNDIPTDLKEGSSCLVRLLFEDSVLLLKSKVVRLYGDVLAVSFTDCESNGKLTPLPELARIYTILQQRWLAERIQN